MKQLTLKSNLKKADDDRLTFTQEEIISDLTASQGNRFDDRITLLLEIERELTLRETN